MATPKEAHLAGQAMRESVHACAFFHDREEEYRALLPFAREGFEQGELGFHIVREDYRTQRIERLGRAGMPVARDGKELVKVRTWDQTYLRDGRFEQDRMLGLIEQALRDGRREGFPRTRLWANMEWANLDRPGVEDLVEYETRLNTVLPHYDDIVICTYDLRQFGAAVALDILRTHPMVIIGGLLQENPFYVPPEAFLQELRGRKSDPVSV